MALVDLVDGAFELTSGQEEVGAGGAGDAQVDEFQAAAAVSLALAQGVMGDRHVAAGGRVGGADTKGEGVADGDVGGGLLGGGGGGGGPGGGGREGRLAGA